MEYMYAHMSLLKDFIRNCKGTLPAIRHLLYRYIGHLTKITNKFCSEKAASVIEFDSQVISYIRLHGMWTFNRAGKQATDDLMKKNNLQNKLNPSDVKAFHAYVAGERSATQPRERPPRSASSYKRAPVSNFSRSSPTKRRRSSQSPSHDLRDQITKYTPDENRYPANHRIFNNQPLPMGQNYRPKYCDFFNKTGSCKHGTRCQYVHACANCKLPCALCTGLPSYLSIWSEKLLISK
uniref:C3H1-type domain-containing protein n=1 Tax=Ciona savignyi TaxID=51511 RepID=H2YE31_CIOSA